MTQAILYACSYLIKNLLLPLFAFWRDLLYSSISSGPATGRALGAVLTPGEWVLPPQQPSCLSQPEPQRGHPSDTLHKAGASGLITPKEASEKPHTPFSAEAPTALTATTEGKMAVPGRRE